MLSVLWTALTVSVGASSVGASETVIPHDTAVFRWLDKVAGRVVTIEAPVGQTFHIAGSTLRFLVHTCLTHHRTETPESAAFLEIWEGKQAEHAVDVVFRGWMFASRPAFSAMEHPIYDGWLLTCQKHAGRRFSSF